MDEIAKTYMRKFNVVNSVPYDANYMAARDVVIENKSYQSNTTGTTRYLNVILPPDYSTDQKYPVLYLLHGLFCDEDTMLDMGGKNVPANLIDEDKAKEMIIVLPNEYAPAPGTSVAPSYKQEYFDGYDNFINELINDIMPFIEKNYSIATGRENTAIAGFSMGGRNALYIGYTRPDLFGYIAAFSPAPGVTPGKDFSGIHKGLFQENEFKIKEPNKYTPYITLISCGTNDHVVNNFPKSYHDILTSNGQPHIWIEIPGAEHDTSAVVAGLYNFVCAIFGNLN